MHELVNYEAEVSVLGKVLVEGMLFKELIVEEKHFYEKRHQVIFRECWGQTPAPNGSKLRIDGSF